MSAPETRIIKRYANRKLYDTRDSRYVTLDQISEMIRQGEDIKVVDNSTKDDLTSVTLAQIVFEEEKRKKSFLPLAALRKIIESGGESLHEFVTHISSSAGRVFKKDGELAGEAAEAAAGHDGEDADEAQDEKIDEGKAQDGKMADFVDAVQGAFDSWQKKLDSNITSALESMSPLAPLQKDVQALRERINELEAQLAQEQKKDED